MAKTFVLVLAVFPKKLRSVLGLNKGLTLRLVGKRLRQFLNLAQALTNAHFSFTNRSKLVKRKSYQIFPNYFLYFFIISKKEVVIMFFPWKTYPSVPNINSKWTSFPVYITRIYISIIHSSDYIFLKKNMYCADKYYPITTCFHILQVFKVYSILL